MYTSIGSKKNSKGQSLVETALFLPILLIIIGGLVEISNVLVTQNRVSTAARAATGFGAANFRAEEWDNPDTWAVSMANVATNNVTDTMNLDPGVWDIYAVKATLNPAATSFEEWNAQHAYGEGSVLPDDEWDTMETQIQTDVIDALDPSQAGLEVVATVAFHNRDSILGLDSFNLGAFTRVRGLSVMRVYDQLAVNGCGAFPIAVSLNNRSVWPVDDPNMPEGDEEFPFKEGESYGGKNYHWPGWSDNPKKNPPVYEVGNTEQFINNVPGRSILDAQKGDIFLTKQATESDSSGFGWLRWIKDNSGGSNSAQALADSLIVPGNSGTYNYPPWSNDGLGIGDLVPVGTGAVSSAKDIMRTHVDAGRMLKLIVFTPTNINNGDDRGPGAPEYAADGYGTNGSGSNLEYELNRFVVVKVIAWYLPGNGNWLLFEFVSRTDDC